MGITERSLRWLQTVLVVVAILAGSAHAQFAGKRTSNLGAGLRVGPSKGATELEDQDEFHIQGFLQRRILHRWQGELGLGYGQLTNTRYSTDMLMAHARLLRTLVAFEDWYGYWYSGIGIIDYDIKAADGVADPAFESLGLTRSLTTGAGFQVSMNDKLTLEVGGGYTYAFTDRLNGTRADAGNDAFWNWSLGLRIEERPRGSDAWRPAPQASEEPPPVEEPPVEEPESFVPSAAELQHGTNPNQADSDGGGVGDGVEVGRDTDPWQPEDDLKSTDESLQFPTIFFATDGARLDAGDEALLDQLAAVLRQHPEVALEIRGYTDDVGDDEANLDLSAARAVAVYEYLLSQGVEQSRLSTRAIGEDEPRTANDNPEGRRRNRRVELRQR